VEKLDVIQEIAEPSYEYNILVDSFNVIKGSVKRGQTMGEILYLNHIDHFEINKIVDKSKGIFDVRRVNTGKKYTVICATDSTKKAQYFIYEIDATNYVVFDLRGEIDVYKGKKPVTVKLKTASGIIKSSLWLTMEEQKLSPKLTAELSTIYAWTIDFFKIQKNDGFRVYYEDKYIDGQYIGIGRLLAAEFTHKGQDFYSFYYRENENFGDYYDEQGKTLRKAFLMAPVDYKRISSRYSKRRKHPVTGRWKGHFGTDYAAEKGTPIWSTANGTIIAATYTKNNGNYVKVRHNGTYTTQYLHMSKIKPGIRKGVFVKQGDIIGYVGSTGLATGPHVCYRFWKNDKQVDPFKQRLPPGDPINKENREAYLLVKDSLMQILMN
jgi:murein DD-endopeptidase MepM/ murein hydrolase activator NlpD